MSYPDQSYNLRIELDTKDCDLSDGDINKMEKDLATLRKVVEDFSVSDLYVTVIYHPRHKTYHVKTALALSARKFFTGERQHTVHPAFARCVRKLVHKVTAYKRRMHLKPEVAKQQVGTRHPIVAYGTFDVQQLNSAVREGNYADFSEALGIFEGPLSERIGRWVERYPGLQSQLGTNLKISDIVEEVFLMAFEEFLDRPHDVPAGDWLERFIDPAVRALLETPDEELANISFVQSMRETE